MLRKKANEETLKQITKAATEKHMVVVVVAALVWRR
jgi:hypothetical protein